jgi:hypothetical protein
MLPCQVNVYIYHLTVVISDPPVSVLSPWLSTIALPGDSTLHSHVSAQNRVEQTILISFKAITMSSLLSA